MRRNEKGKARRRSEKGKARRRSEKRKARRRSEKGRRGGGVKRGRRGGGVKRGRRGGGVKRGRRGGGVKRGRRGGGVKRGRRGGRRRRRKKKEGTLLSKTVFFDQCCLLSVQLGKEDIKTRMPSEEKFRKSKNCFGSYRKRKDSTDSEDDYFENIGDIGRKIENSYYNNICSGKKKEQFEAKPIDLEQVHNEVKNLRELMKEYRSLGTQDRDNSSSDSDVLSENKDDFENIVKKHTHQLNYYQNLYAKTDKTESDSTRKKSNFAIENSDSTCADSDAGSEHSNSTSENSDSKSENFDSSSEESNSLSEGEYSDDEYTSFENDELDSVDFENDELDSVDEDESDDSNDDEDSLNQGEYSDGDISESTSFENDELDSVDEDESDDSNDNEETDISDEHDCLDSSASEYEETNLCENESYSDEDLYDGQEETGSSDDSNDFSFSKIYPSDQEEADLFDLADEDENSDECESKSQFSDLYSRENEESGKNEEFDLSDSKEKSKYLKMGACLLDGNDENDDIFIGDDDDIDEEYGAEYIDDAIKQEKLDWKFMHFFEMNKKHEPGWENDEHLHSKDTNENVKYHTDAEKVMSENLESEDCNKLFNQMKSCSGEKMDPKLLESLEKFKSFFESSVPHQKPDESLKQDQKRDDEWAKLCQKVDESLKQSRQLDEILKPTQQIDEFKPNQYLDEFLKQSKPNQQLKESLKPNQKLIHADLDKESLKARQGQDRSYQENASPCKKDIDLKLSGKQDKSLKPSTHEQKSSQEKSIPLEQAVALINTHEQKSSQEKSSPCKKVENVQKSIPLEKAVALLNTHEQKRSQDKSSPCKKVENVLKPIPLEKSVDLLKSNNEHSLLLRDMPEHMANSEEECIQVVLLLFSDSLRIRMLRSDIVTAIRVGTKRGDKERPRPIFVTFVDGRMKDMVYAAKDMLKEKEVLIMKPPIGDVVNVLGKAFELFGCRNVGFHDDKVMTFVDIYLLEPNTSYVFRIWANNKLGAGEIVQVEALTKHDNTEIQLARHLLIGLEDFDTRIWLAAVTFVMTTLLILVIAILWLFLRECHRSPLSSTLPLRLRKPHLLRTPAELLKRRVRPKLTESSRRRSSFSSDEIIELVPNIICNPNFDGDASRQNNGDDGSHL
ncbi:hypothetical protein WDU94_006116 [Cyamophila willieti]